ncbi:MULTISPECIES: type II toxin-antitoxin system VapC family toxin [unclassified Gordonia (in: high G+C Gram-positive bacteria)]|uniref:type II toxin-antitoxin system VapC family toxin n=1 Tax=unclassified Gordonia (in: high G+C Gram-positive bacteria) TaxID=2657482 RepID=UPI001F10E964|nr:type II toxin-antitoxin system VapC family toxin [Gordonia sp. ABSL49_1]MCH5645331.1 type II toxin-antitoxin system VapC family toxin [Gordonia sp. ABSL49_1]
MSQRFAVDTSVAVPFLVASHAAHEVVRSRIGGRPLALSGHALLETYSVLTRLPGDARVAPPDAVLLIDDNFVETLGLPEGVVAEAHRLLARFGIAGGATYDALVALAARENDAVLITRDARARPTYDAVGARVEEIVG